MGDCILKTLLVQYTSMNSPVVVCRTCGKEKLNVHQFFFPNLFSFHLFSD